MQGQLIGISHYIRSHLFAMLFTKVIQRLLFIICQRGSKKKKKKNSQD